LAAANGDSASNDSAHDFKGCLEKFNINIADAQDLLVLRDYNVVLMIDDSNSMGLPAKRRSIWNPLKPPPTRWMELQEATFVLIELANCCSGSSVDVFFLNRGQIHNIKSADDARLSAAFDEEPGGGSPLTETLIQVSAHSRTDKPTLLIVLTDGEPTGGFMPFFEELHHVIGQTDAIIKVQIMACTSDPNSIGWLNLLDREFEDVDVTDDYLSERSEVLKSRKVDKFTRGDWLVKALLGPISSKFDQWNENPSDTAY